MVRYRLTGMFSASQPRKSRDTHPYPTRHKTGSSSSDPLSPLPEFDSSSSSDRDYATTVSLKSSSKLLDSPGFGESYTIVEYPASGESNSLFVYRSDFKSGIPVLLNGRFPLSTQQDGTGKLYQKQVGLSTAQRKLMDTSLVNDTVTVLPLRLPSEYISIAFLDLEVDFLQSENPRSYSADELSEHFVRTFKGRSLGRDQQVLFAFKGQYFKATVKDTIMQPTSPEWDRTSQVTLGGLGTEMGTVTDKTKVVLSTAADSSLTIKEKRYMQSYITDSTSSSPRPQPDPLQAPVGVTDRPISLPPEQLWRKRGFTYDAQPQARKIVTDSVLQDQYKTIGRTRSLPSPTGDSAVKDALAGNIIPKPHITKTSHGPLDHISLSVDTSDLAALANNIDLAVEFPTKTLEMAKTTAGDLILPVGCRTPLEPMGTNGGGNPMENWGKDIMGLSKTRLKARAAMETPLRIAKSPPPNLETKAATGTVNEGILKENNKLTNRAPMERTNDGQFKRGTNPSDRAAIETEPVKKPQMGIFEGARTPAESPIAGKPQSQLHPILTLISNPKSLGIGGLDKEFRSLFKRALASRLSPPNLFHSLGREHVKGILFHGPPGTGKTLLARKLAECLGAKLKIVSGPEVFEKFIGDSEKKVRELFADAELEFKEKRFESDLHMIIFDEIDALAKRRGNETGSTGRVGDNIVNQLLAKMDGAEPLHNVLIIGTTNRFDMIDEALLRPGRFEVQFKFGMPDLEGRNQILNTHVSEMRNNSRLGTDVNLTTLAEQTSSFSGADIAGLVTAAVNMALSRYQLFNPSNEPECDFRVTMDDFREALNQVRPTNQPPLEELEQAIPYGIMAFDSPFNITKTVLKKGKLFVKQASASPRPVSILLHGPPETGKTALAVTIAKESNFSFVRLVSPNKLAGRDESQQIAEIKKVVYASRKCHSSVIVLDDVENLLGWDPINQTYSMNILRVLSSLLQRPPPKGHGLLIITTSSSRSVLDKLQLLKLFDSQMLVPPISTSDAVCNVLREIKLFSATKLKAAMDKIRQCVSYEQDPTRIPPIGIKRLLRIVDMAKQEHRDEIAGRLVEELLNNMGDPEIRRALPVGYASIDKLD